jgi:hypothetical protein
MHKKLGLLEPTPKIKIPIEIQLFIMAGHDYNLCPKCKEGYLRIESSYKTFNGQLVNVKDLAQRKIYNKASSIKRRLAAKATVL